MKKLNLIIILAMVLALTGCGSSDKKNQPGGTGNGVTQGADDAASKGEQKEGYEFVGNGVTIPMNVEAEPIIKALGDSQSYFEAASCAFQGLDKMYTYAGFEVDTYPNDGVDYISSVDIKDDTVSTLEGISIGSTFDEVKAAYGEDYTESSGAYTYIKGDSRLTFIIKDDAVDAITYLANVEELQ